MNKNRKHTLVIGIMFLLVSIWMTGCGAATKTNAGSQAPSVDVPSPVVPSPTVEASPVQVENMGETLTVSAAPTRAVTLNQHVTEIMLALGLQDSMVGTAYLDDQILPEYQEAYASIPVLSDKYPSVEVFMAADPDFVYAGWKSAYSEKALGDRQQLADKGILTYLQESSNKTSPTLEDVYTDIRNIGRIFHVEARADELIQKMKDEMGKITSKLGAIETPVEVFVYDSGEDAAFTAANNYMTALIRQAGGHNIFDDIEKGWAEVSWEEVVNRNPEVIVIVDYGATSAEEKIAFLKNKASLAGVKAIQEERFVILPLSAAAEGIRAPLALETLAKGLYPNRMK